MSYFNLKEAADRYDKYRPKVHDVIKDWLLESDVKTSFDKALDVACGTGDSTLPLKGLAKDVIGIDQSAHMLSKAQEKGLEVFQMSYLEAPSLGRFDFITTCMAFHWFESKEAIQAYKGASNTGAIWLIYNFYFSGHESSEEFNSWFYDEYLSKYPSPTRGRHSAEIDKNDKTIIHLNGNEGHIPISLSKDKLVKYLTTQSNIENVVLNGKTYKNVEQDLTSEIKKIKCSTSFKYGYQYDFYKYVGN